MSSCLRSSIKQALLLATAGIVASGVSPQALAQSKSPPPTVEEIEIVVITGSLIEGTARDTALPVQVITADDLEKQGARNIVDVVKSIPSVQGVLGETNQFGTPQSTGVAAINLRGLASVRTLVLLNGRRLPTSPATPANGGAGGVDVNLLPTAAIGRIEVLKDGAAATYGSDAIGGVVNFITRQGVDGLTVDGSYTYIEDSDGDYSTNLVWGKTGETYDFLVTAGYRHRSELQARDRDFALRSFAENPQGGFSSFGNPGVYQLLNPAGTAPIGTFRDPACGTLGGVEQNPSTGPICQFQFTQFANLVEREEDYNLYSEFNTELFNGSTRLHVEAFYAAHDVPEENSSPSFAPTQGAGVTATNPSNAPNFFIPVDNPGLKSLMSILTQDQRNMIAAAGGVRASGLQFRPIGLGGNPLTGEGKKDSRFFDAYRFSTDLSGDFNKIGWNLGLTYSQSNRDADTGDILVAQLDRALRGFGGSNCTGTVAGANGCSYFNPFSTGIARNPALGLVNPAIGTAPGATFDPSTVNNSDVIRSLFGNYSLDDTTTLFVLDAVLNGETGLTLPGGKVAWALGAQYREDKFERDFNDVTNVDVNPCADTPINGNTTCTTQAGPLGFLGALREVDLTDDVYGVFTELSLPLLPSVQAQLAYRYEDYGGKVGSTSNPKLAVRWQPLDWLGFRASFGSTFRGPLQTSLVNDATTTLQFVSLVGNGNSGFKPFDNFGNSNLKPEEADTLSAGFFINAGPFTASLDYYNVDLDDPINNEPGPQLVSQFFGTATAPLNNCGNPAFAGLQQRFAFANGVCSPQTLLRTRVNLVNGPNEKTSGLDLNAQYRFNGVLKGNLAVGVEASYMLEYERDPFVVEGVTIANTGGRDFAGTRGTFVNLLELRGSVYLDWSTQTQNVRLTTRYLDGVTDLRSVVARPVTGQFDEVASFTTVDLVYRLLLPSDTTVTASVFNLADRDPPFVRQDLNYEPFVANPVGRQVKVALSKRF